LIAVLVVIGKTIVMGLCRKGKDKEAFESGCGQKRRQ
jgi:hypothetical protein